MVPEVKRTIDTEIAKFSQQTDIRTSNEEPARPAPSPLADNQHPSEPKAGTGKASDDADIQGKLVTFTKLLVVVGFLQFFALVGQVAIYCRQAKIMGRQAHEMKRQRGYMRLQWKAMGVQATHMAGQLTEMQESRKIENRTLILQYRPRIVIRNAKVLNFSFELGEPGECEMRFIMVNTGGSPAYITAGGFIQLLSLIGHNVGKIEIKDGDRVAISQFTLQPGQQVTVEEVLPTGTVNNLEWANFREGIQTEPLKYLYLIGTIYYLDDLNIPRATGIHRKYNPKSEDFEPQKESESEYTD
jgi:hypothetical protein